MIVRNVQLFGDRYVNGQKFNGFDKAILEEGQEVYLGNVKGFNGAYDKCDELGHDTKQIRDKTDEWVKTGKSN